MNKSIILSVSVIFSPLTLFALFLANCSHKVHKNIEQPRAVIGVTFNSIGRSLFTGTPLEKIKKNPSKWKINNNVLEEEFKTEKGALIDHSHMSDIVSFVDRYYWHLPLVNPWVDRSAGMSLDSALEQQSYPLAFLLLK